MLASRPRDFADCSDIVPASLQNLTDILGLPTPTEPHYTHTNSGIRIQLPLRSTQTTGVFIAALACRDDSSSYWQALVLRQIDGEHTYERIGPGYREQWIIIDATSHVSWKCTTIYIKRECEPRDVLERGVVHEDLLNSVIRIYDNTQYQQEQTPEQQRVRLPYLSSALADVIYGIPMFNRYSDARIPSLPLWCTELASTDRKEPISTDILRILLCDSEALLYQFMHSIPGYIYGEMEWKKTLQKCAEDLEWLKSGLVAFYMNNNASIDLASNILRAERSEQGSSGVEIYSHKQIPLDELVQRDLCKFVLDIYHPTQPQLSMGPVIDDCYSQEIDDPDIRKLWKKMGWHRSIESRTFALNLYHYCIDLERGSRPTLGSRVSITASQLPGLQDSLLSGSDTDMGRGITLQEAAQDAWALTEAIDVRIDGFIDIEDVNQFTSSKPECITLMQWIAYSVYGSTFTTHIYCLRIESIITRIPELEPAEENREVAVGYMDRWLPRVVALLQDIRVPNPTVQHEEQLLELTRTIMTIQENKINAELTLLNYESYEGSHNFERIMSTSSDRGCLQYPISDIEQRLLPTLYLVLKHHYAILSIAQEYVLEKFALSRASETMKTIWYLVDSRLNHLRSRQLSTPGIDETMQLLMRRMKELKKYDPKFQANTSFDVDESLFLSVTSLAGYRLRVVKSYRKRLGITLVPSVVDDQVEQCLEISGTAGVMDQEHEAVEQCVYDDIGDGGDDVDYCSPCYESLELLPPPDVSGSDAHISYQFLRIEQDIEAIGDDDVLDRIFGRPGWHLANWAEGPELSEDDYDFDNEFYPLLEHCLSASEDVNQRLMHAVSAYWKQRRNFDHRQTMPELSELSAFPKEIVEYVTSHCFVRQAGSADARRKGKITSSHAQTVLISTARTLVETAELVYPTQNPYSDVSAVRPTITPTHILLVLSKKPGLAADKDFERTSHANTAKSLKNAQVVIENLTKKSETTETQMAQIKEKMAQMEADMDARIARMEADMEKRLAQMNAVKSAERARREDDF
ncbi:uncharacterized protein TRAVEDRAFT_18758 [Trametes versicolor FP-101664 SS1]|uniref:uncharacterized protein n=1 Tax=Trametes versicolor (strain FP-101664) TaxID=717944 RepID=UPI00046228FC|nr:uncharacterized protein TRAVEDRAFT_18758 [Trametes versicolor FP-101664 SS1]EIW62343.1 hypothetical protein TRAVEDRAFT_18758 [Trametes versicolor FP-101664 SS1]